MSKKDLIDPLLGLFASLRENFSRKAAKPRSATARPTRFSRSVHTLLTQSIVSAVLFTAVAGAQNPREREQQSPPSQPAQPEEKRVGPAVLVSSDEDYRIGPRDVLDIQIENATELSGTFNVSADGTFLMPYLGRIRAVNKTPEDLAKELADGLRGRYLKDPRVSVGVKQYNSRSIFLQGSVRSPGVYQVEAKTTLLKLISFAGGLAENHGSTAFIIREVKPNQPEAGAAPDPAAENKPPYEMITANINGLMFGNFEQDIPVQAGDIVNIPPTDVFFVAGEVVAPGSFSLKPGTTLRQAIALARGFTFSAAKGRGVIFRENTKTGGREDIKVDVGAVMNGKRDDVAIHANDIIIVPNSSLKSFGGALLRGFGTSFVTRGIPY
jgi:polysaccharide export outer membrane protein